MYLDKAVVEKEADETGADAGILGECVAHGCPHDGLRLGARLLVVPDLELGVGGTAARGSLEQRTCDQDRKLKTGSHGF
jgi:hypothetical protein